MVNVFANGIWKSGNHLLVKILQQLSIADAKLGIAASLMNGRGYIARQIIRGAWFDPDPVMVGLEKATNISTIWLSRRLSKMSGVYVGGHAAYSERLLSLLEANNFKSIQIVRDPRDIVVSFAYWIETRPDFFLYPYFAPLSVEARMRLLIEGSVDTSVPVDSIATVMDRSYGWLTNAGKVLVVRFEDLVGEKGGGSYESQLQSIKSICRWLKKDESLAASIGENLFGGTNTFRKGKAGSWKEEMPESLQDLFDNKVGTRLKLFQYD